MSLLTFGRSDPRWLILILVVSALAAIGLALLAWFALPLVVLGGVRPFEGEVARLLVVLAIVLAWGALNAVLRARRNSADQARLDALDRQEFEAQVRVDTDRQASEAAYAEVRAGARRAFRRLRGRRWIDILIGRGRSLPRYLVIGPPASGKTSALAAADLNLPFDARGADEPEADPACRFVVSDGAVFADVSGDLLLGTRPAWAGLWPRLLDLLRAARPAQPVNGVILVVAATELAGLDDESRADLAHALRTRLDEIVHRLRVRVPVYLLLSKLDRVPGFGEFFENLGAEERAGLWGVAVASLERTSARAAARLRFGEDFDDLVRRASTRQISFLHGEPDAAQRVLAFEFLAQLASLRDHLAAFLEEVARPNSFDEPPFLRGVFLSSALQDGSTVDSIGAPLARAFALDRPAMPRAAPRGGLRRRAYFLKRLLGEVILAEAGSGGLSRKGLLVARLRAHGTRAAAAALLTAGGLLLWSSYRQAGLYVTEVSAAADGARASLARLDAAGKAQPARAPVRDFAPTLAALDGLAALDAAAEAPAPESLVNIDEIRPAADAAYRGGLRTLLIPHTLRVLAARIGDPAGPAALRFQSLKLYLMLGQARPPPPGLLADLGPALAVDWLGTLDDPAALQRTVGHLAALAEVALPAQAIDEGLVAQARRRLTGTTVAQIGYEMVRQQAGIRALRPWRPVDHAGSLGPRAIARASGTSLSDGVPGLFTAGGLSDVTGAASAVAEGLAADSWVFGAQAADQPNLAPRAIQAGILDLYRADYVRAWEGLLADFTVPPMPTAAAAAELLSIVNGPSSPIVQLLNAAVSETSLDREVADGIVQGIRLQAGASALANSPVATSPITGALLPRASVAALLQGPRQTISRQFAPLREAVTRPKEGQDSDVDAVLKSLDPLYRQLLLVTASAPLPEQPMTPGASLTQAAINRLPLSIRPYFTRLTTETAALVKWDVRGRAAAAWAANVRPACESTVAKAFPFDLRADRDVPLGEFTRLFSPNGLIASFRRTQLANLVDTSGRPWRWREGRAALPSDPPDPTLAMFERADAITAAFFAEGDRPQIRFTLEPSALAAKAERMQFDVGGASLTYAHGPEVPFTGQWPPPTANAPATLSLTPEIDGTTNALVGEGQWALFRLVAQGRFLAEADAMMLVFDVGRRQVRLRLSTATLKNPFDLRLMAGFRCPVF